MQRSEYKDTFAISQSAIKAFKTKPLQKFKQIYIDKEEDDDEDDSKYAFGSLCDTLSFQPELVDERFYIPDEEVKVPGEKVKFIVDKVYKDALSLVENRTLLNEQGNLPERLYVPDITHLSEFQDIILKYALENKFGGTTWGKSRILTAVVDDGSSYFRLLGTAGNRHIITLKDNADALEVVDMLRRDKDSMPFFVQQEGERLLFQQEIFSEFKTKTSVVPIKGALDILRINHNEKWVQEADLKCTHNVDEFGYIAKKFDYLTQRSFYNYLLREFLKTYDNGSCKNYKILPPVNVAIARDSKIPYIFEFDFDEVDICQRGSDELGIVGWETVLDNITWHLQTGIWSKPREHNENGKIKLKIYNK